MYIPILQDGEVENELNIELCCYDCARANYQWSIAQFTFVKQLADNAKPITVPAEVDKVATFAQYIKNMKL